MNLLEFLGLNIEKDRPLMRTLEREYSVTTMLCMAADISHRLTAFGVAGRKVIVSLDNGPLFFSSIVGSWMAGAQPVLLDPLVRRELNRAIVRTEAAAVIRDGDTSLPLYVTGREVPQIAPDESQSSDIPFDRVLPTGKPIVYLFTSGSTGEPLVVPKNLAQLDVEIQFISELFAYPGRVATMVPWCHIYGFLASFLVPLRSGALLDISAGISPKALIEHVDRGQLDLVVAVPAIFRVMNRLAGEMLREPVKHGCRFVSAGAPLAEEDWQTFSKEFDAPITELYGSTEAGGVAYRHDTGPWMVEPHVKIHLDKSRQLLVCSPSVSVEVEGSYFPMGDLVELVGGGFRLRGRIDDVVKIGGRRVALGEIEGVIETHPNVREVAVVCTELRGQVRLVAFVAADRGALGQDDIRSFVRERLADHKVPRLVHFKDKLPRNPGGKVDRQALMRRT